MIGIITQYGRNETTMAAIRVADLAMALGLEVRLSALLLREKNVHPFWDQRVLAGNPTGIYKSMRYCTHVVHFECNETALNNATLVAADAKHILVPRWHSIRRADKHILRKYNLIVCPSKACADLIRKELVGDDEGWPPITWSKFDSGYPAIRRDKSVVADRVKACIFCDASAIDFSGPGLLQAVLELLQRSDRLDITLVSTKSWSRRERKTIVQLGHYWDPRFKFAHVGNFKKQLLVFHQHDWVVVAGVRADFGITASRILSCGSPLIAYNVEPYSEIILDGHNGLLIPCDVRHGHWKVPMAVPNTTNLLKICASAFNHQQHLYQLQSRDWGLTEFRQSFDRVWTEWLT